MIAIRDSMNRDLEKLEEQLAPIENQFVAVQGRLRYLRESLPPHGILERGRRGSRQMSIDGHARRNSSSSSSGRSYKRR